jgi:glucose/arabinose dehydrogenase
VTPTPDPGSTDDIDVLAFSATAGFRHPSIADAKAFLGGLPDGGGIRATITEDPQLFNDEFLSGFDVVAFINTTGDVLNDEQQAATERFIRSGKGYVGVHSAADTEYAWPWYGRLVGAYFISHPLLPVEVEVTTEDADHPSTSHLEPSFLFTDEIYNFDRNPRHDNSILLTIDEEGFIFPNFPDTPSMGADHPIAWYKEFEGGRSFYTNLGHRPGTWRDPRFQQHLLEGIRWASEPLAYSRIVLTGKASNPLALAVAPDGRVFYIERSGEVRAWSPATGRVNDAIVLDVSLTGENGLLGIALDPDFAVNGYVYLYHSEPDLSEEMAENPFGENVLSRFHIDEDSVIDPDSRLDLLRVPSDRINHEGGSLAFGPDGSLFLSTGDNTDPFSSNGYAPLDERPGEERFNSQRTAGNPFDLRGKILRINPDGSVPEGNLFPPSGEEGRPEIFVMGCRNPFRIAVDPVTGRLFWGDVGPDALGDSERGPRGYDEINFADAPGFYGWPFCIAQNIPYADYDFATETVGPPFSCVGMVPALIAYDYTTVSYLALGNALDLEGNPALPGLPIGFTGRTAIAGVFYRAPEGAPFAMPDAFRDKLIMAEWTRDILAAVEVSPEGELQSLRRVLPFEPFRRPIDLETGADGALYVLEYGTSFFGDNPDARVSRIEYSAAGELSPVAVANASITAGVAPLTVSFEAGASRAPGRGDAIASYEWDLNGDGTVDETASQFEYDFEENGVYPVTLVVVGESGRRSLPTVVEIIVANTPPEVTILEPADGAVFTEGDMVTLRGEATDFEDGVADCDDLTWDIRLGHNAHSHPFALLHGCEVTFRASPIAHDSSTGLFYAVELSYTDKGGPGGEPALTARQGIRIRVQPAPAV